MTKPRNLKFGQIKDKPDARDFVFSAPARILAALPTQADLRKGCLQPPYDQGELGSCTANAIASSVSYAHKRQMDGVLQPSRLFIYYNERVLEGTVNEDSGASLRNGIKTLNSDGVCPENLQPYNIEKFTVKPPSKCYNIALKDRVVKYQRIVQTLDQMKGCLAAGQPFMFGMLVFDSFMSDEVAETGIVPMPSRRDGILGGHAVMAVGYNDKYNRFLVRNSWGVNQGIKGCFTIPYEYLVNGNLVADLQRIKLISG